jgi:hypothetical protein
VTFNANYTLIGATGSATINPALLTITANNVGILPGASPLAFSVSYSGLAGGDTVSPVQGLSVTTDATAQSAPGAYAITPSGATAPNYDVVYVDGVLSIRPARTSWWGKSSPRQRQPQSPARDRRSSHRRRRHRDPG